MEKEDLVGLAKGLALKAEKLTNESTLSPLDTFRLRNEIKAAAKKIAVEVDGPEQSMKGITRGYTTSTALKICIDLCLAKLLAQNGPQSTRDLASVSGCDAKVLVRTLRLLSQHGIFQQTSDGKWTNTKMSHVMCEPPFVAWATSILEEKYRSTAHLPTLLRETGYRLPPPGKTAFNAVYGTALDFYAHSSQFDHDAASNFAVSMEQLARIQLSFFQDSYPLDRLDPQTHFIDVAGGFGFLSCFLAKLLPEATFEVQDYPFVVEGAQKVCPPALRDRVLFRSHDMLSAQPAIDRLQHPHVVFLLKIILHDHGDDECKLALDNMLSAMGTGDRILVIDTVISDTGGGLSASTSDMIILSMFGGAGHRTLQEFRALIDGGGKYQTVFNTFSRNTGDVDDMMVIEIQKL